VPERPGVRPAENTRSGAQLIAHTIVWAQDMHLMRQVSTGIGGRGDGAGGPLG